MNRSDTRGGRQPAPHTERMIDHLQIPSYIAVDLDGTILTRDKHITQRTLNALKSCQRQGILLAFVTGRTYAGARKFIEIIKPDAAVLSYGAHVMAGDATIYRRYISARVGSKLLRKVKNAEYIRFQSENGECFTDRDEDNCLPLDRNAVIKQRLDHLCAWGLPAEQAITISRQIRCSLTQLCASDWCNFAAYGCNKESGFRRLLTYLKLPAGRGIAFGDEDCDIGFFKVCGTGVAMKNGDRATKTAADHVTESNEEDGVAVFLERNILEKHII